MRISDWSSDVCSSDLLALLGQQGGLRPLRARLAPYLRASGCHQQLLQQLRPLPVSREADPADDPFGAAGPASAGLWQGRERSRLAARGGSRAGPGRRAEARKRRVEGKRVEGRVENRGGR